MSWVENWIGRSLKFFLILGGCVFVIYLMIFNYKDDLFIL